VKHDKERREQPYFSEGVNGGEAPPEEAQAIASMYSRVADAVKGEGCEGEDNGEGALEHKVARGGMLSYLFRVQSDLGLNIEALAHRLLHWTSAQGEGFIQESFLVHEESLPFLRVALAPHCSSSSNTEASTTTNNNNTKQMEEEAIAKALESGSSSNCFRHELQQSSIITNILLAVQRARREDSRVGGSAPPAAGVGAGGDKKVARKEEREEQLAPPPPTLPPSFAGARVIETLELPRCERVKAPPLFVEFGAGRGMLSATLASLMDPCNMLLIERAPINGKKADREVNRKGGDSMVHRLRIDIQDCSLREALKLPAASHASENGIVAMGKHLCGGATDLALRALLKPTAVVNSSDTFSGHGPIPPPVQITSTSDITTTTTTATTTTKSPTNNGGGRACQQRQSPQAATALHAIGIALCCHHACTWAAYVGKEWWRRVFRGSAVEFEVCRYISSWALLDETRDTSLESSGHGGNTLQPPSTMTCTLAPPPDPLWAAGLDTSRKAAIGRAAKRVIDAGRLAFLAQSLPEGNGRLVTYCSPKVSLENVLLLWHP